jgi:two-component system, OmpR family, response regulator
VRHFLTKAGFSILESVDGKEALNILGTTTIDLIVLDVMIPPPNGWQLCRSIKSVRDVPVLMLTAKRETPDKLKGFELGADDYVVKPFDPLELVARVRALLKRYRIEASQKLTVGLLELDRSAYQVTVQGRAQTIPRKEFELLFKLSGAPGRTFSREQLIESVWGPDFDGNERTLDVHVNRLRKRFPERPCRYRIATVRGLGYRMETET